MTGAAPYDRRPGFVGPPNPDTDHPPPGDEAVWAAWWQSFNARWKQTHAIDGTSPADGLEDIEEQAGVLGAE